MAVVQSGNFAVAIARALGRVVLTVHGSLDELSAPVLRTTLHDLIDDQGNLDVIVDLDRLSYVDDAGVAALEEGFTLAAARGGVLTLSRPRPAVERVLEARSSVAWRSTGSGPSAQGSPRSWSRGSSTTN
jgi:anti-anti-sigma factor